MTVFKQIMQLIYTAEHLQVLWSCAPPGPHSGVEGHVSS